ncbi:hypothetical protein [Melioribacter sp. OK-6-Me]|uniref:hypothetical protein n=1 Tax=unclassified Melioribacter TaxID=2627329 RepID=UPI003EDA21BA
MKSRQLFWGFFFLTIGALTFSYKYDWIQSNYDFIWNIWPLIFVFWGSLIIFKDSFIRHLINLLFGIFMAVLLFGFIINIFNGCEIYTDSTDDYTEYKQDQLPEVKYASLNFNSGAGYFEIDNLTDKFYETEVQGALADYNIHSYTDDSTAYLDIELDGEHDIVIDGKKFKNNLLLHLNNKPVWDFNLNFGAAKGRFDLRNLKTRSISIKTGASDVVVKLGDKYETTLMDVEMGAAKLTLYIPENSACSMKSDLFLVSRNLEGIEKVNPGYYKSANYDTAKKKIDIFIKGGISSFNLKRY